MVDLDIQILRTFLVVASTRNLTQAAYILRRTQPAITLQLQRLERLLGRSLWEGDRKGHVLTKEGEQLLMHARRLIDMNDEICSEFKQNEPSGRVILGTPDIYAAYLLPMVLPSFSAMYPRVELELRCALSLPLLEELKQGRVDLALITHNPAIMKSGGIVSKERLVWVSATSGIAHLETPLPLAVYPPGNLYRDLAIAALDRANKSWKVTCISESVSGIHAAVLAGLAVSVLPLGALAPGMMSLDDKVGFPELPPVDLALHQSPHTSTEAIRQLARHIRQVLTGVASG